MENTNCERCGAKKNDNGTHCYPCYKEYKRMRNETFDAAKHYHNGFAGSNTRELSNTMRELERLWLKTGLDVYSGTQNEYIEMLNFFNTNKHDT